eukprot:8391473-Pyramimonas_sp.AAC.1
MCKFIQYVGPPSSKDASRIPPENCEVPDILSKAAPTYAKSLCTRRIVDVSQLLVQLEVLQLLVHQGQGVGALVQLEQVRLTGPSEDAHWPLRA